MPPSGLTKDAPMELGNRAFAEDTPFRGSMRVWVKIKPAGCSLSFHLPGFHFGVTVFVDPPPCERAKSRQDQCFGIILSQRRERTAR